jgi:hypothetical protein
MVLVKAPLADQSFGFFVIWQSFNQLFRPQLKQLLPQPVKLSPLSQEGHLSLMTLA